MKDRIQDLLFTPSGKWDNKIAFSPAEVCEMLGLARSSLAVYYNSGMLRAMRIGKHWRITRKDLIAFLEQALDESRVI